MRRKKSSARTLANVAVKNIRNSKKEKMNLIWLEASGCSGNIISLLNANNPDIVYLFRQMVNLKFDNSIMLNENELAYEEFLNTLDTDFILAVDGAVSTKEDGRYNIIANYKGKPITAMEAVKLAGEKAKYILAVGTCASFGGISAAAPNPSKSVSVGSLVNKQVINLPGCPCHPDWVIGTIANIILAGMPQLDNKNRPVLFYGTTIHDNCSRRSFFDNKIFASKLGDKECMFKLGCRGPITKTDCPLRNWNSHINWPVGDNTPCIGCANDAFPDGMEPFVRY
ncbi:MAG: hydrogenase small subunit [Bacillota bacterium]|nr:hydrogenase small subunit [Bacillota bacterium]